MFLAISLGNSNLRLAVFDGDRILRHGIVPLDREMLDAGSFSGLHGITAAAIASVHPTLLPRLEELLGRQGIIPRVAGRDFEVPIANRYRRPADVGIDRVLGVLAAGRIYPGQGVAVVDFGTALTVNVGSPSGEFLGGVIGIGASTAAAVLARRAPRLPAVRLEAPEGFLAVETERGINDGIVWEIAGGVERILAGLRGSLPFAVRAVATGGDADLIAPRVAGIDRLEPDLVLRGLWISAGGGEGGK